MQDFFVATVVFVDQSRKTSHSRQYSVKEKQYVGIVFEFDEAQQWTSQTAIQTISIYWNDKYPISCISLFDQSVDQLPMLCENVYSECTMRLPSCLEFHVDPIQKKVTKVVWQVNQPDFIRVLVTGKQLPTAVS